MRGLTWLIAVAATAGLCWLFPLFHIVPLEQVTRQRTTARFDPGQFAERFWKEQLLESLDKAVDASALLPAINGDPVEAKKRFSRSVGVTEAYTYFISGKGRVLGVSDDEISLSVTPAATQPEIVLQVGLIFGNAIRDGTGLLNVSDYPNSRDFNGISDALNQIIEKRVLPTLREQAKVGTMIRFFGCAEVNDESTDLTPLRVVPIQTHVE